MICYSYSYSILYFSESRNIGIIKKKNQQICFFIGFRTQKPTRTRTLNRIPIWHGLNVNIMTGDIIAMITILNVYEA